MSFNRVTQRGRQETFNVSDVAINLLCCRFDEMGVLWTAVLNDATIKNGLVLLRSRDTTVKVTSQILHLLQT